MLSIAPSAIKGAARCKGNLMAEFSRFTPPDGLGFANQSQLLHKM